MADSSLLAAILSGNDPLAAQMLPAYQGAQLSQAALDPNFGHNEGWAGALAKTIAGFRGGAMTNDAVNNLVQQRMAAQPEEAKLLANPDPYSELANNPDAYSPLARAMVLNGANPGSVADARLKAAQAAFTQMQGRLASAAAEPMPPMYGNGNSARTGTLQAPGAMSVPQIKQLALDAGFEGSAADTATAIVMAESGGNPNAVGDGGTSFGLSQINAPSWGPIAASAKGNPTQAMKLMYDISGGGQDFRPWSTFKSGAYQKFLPAASVQPIGADFQTGHAAMFGGDGANAPQAAQVARQQMPQNAQSQMPPGVTQFAQANQPEMTPSAPSTAVGNESGQPFNPNMPPGVAQLAQAGNLQINPAFIAEAQRRANINAALGRTTPDFLNKAAGLPFVGPTASAEAWAKADPDIYTKWHVPTDLRQGGILTDPSTGRIIAQAPRLPEGTSLEMGAGGKPIAEEVPGAMPAIQNAARAQHAGQYQAEFGGLPGSQVGAPQSAPSQPSATGSPPSPSASPVSPSNAAPTPRATQLPPISEQFMPQSASELDHAIPAWQKKTDEWNAGIGPARQAEMRLGTIAQAFKMTETGAFETHKAELGALLKGLGVDPSLAMDTNPAAVQMALHDNILTTLPLLKAATPRPSQIEFMSVSENREHPNLQPAANLRMLTEDLALVRQAQQLPADWNMAQQQGWRNPQSFETAWSQLNPLDKTREQIEKEIGPLKGMAETPPAASMSGVPQGAKFAGHSPSTGLNYWQGPDGKYYSAKP